MAYPKPLTQKSLEKRYKEAGLNEEKISFIRTFFTACVNLYGSIQVCYAWDVYKELAGKISCVKLLRKDLLNAAGIMRREPNRFQVYEAEELYEGLRNSDLHREIVHPEMIGYGYGKNNFFVRLKNHTNEVGFYIPEDFMSYADPDYSRTEQEEALRAFVGNLVVNMDEYEDSIRHIMMKCSEHKGEKLKDFSWMNRHETFDLQYARGEITGKRGNEKELEYLTALYNRTEAEKIVKNLIEWNHIGNMSPNELVKYTMEELDWVGVGLSEDQLCELVRLIFEQHNHQHLWCLEGWSPVALGASI